MNPKFSSIILIAIFFIACGADAVLVPKPRMYPRVEFPEKVYQNLDVNYCDFSFEYPKYAELIQDSLFFGDRPEHPCWFDLVIPSLNGKLHCSYFPINSNKELEKHIDDAFIFASKHNDKADYREELVITKPNRVSGILFETGGEVATPLHFFLTDSTDHYFRASLYFYNEVNPDSMAIVNEFVRADVYRLIESFEWTDDSK